MKLGLFGINTGAAAQPEVAAAVARAAEDAGLESLWTGEHVVLPDPQVPPSPAPPGHPMLDPAASLSYLAAHTQRLRLGTGIVILPQRNPLVLAKEMASVDVLSGGRLILGVAAGYLEPEFRALGIPFEGRGPVTDEAIDAIKAIWTQEKPRFQGEHFAFEGVDAHPRPVQQPHPPIVVGGHSPPAWRRAVSRGDGWYGFFQDLEATEAALAGLEKAAKDVERPAGLGALEISITPMPGCDADMAKRYRDLGVHRLIPMPLARSQDEWLQAVEDAASLGEALG